MNGGLVWSVLCSFTGAQRRLAYWIGNNIITIGQNGCDYNAKRVDVVKTRLKMMRSHEAYWATILKMTKFYTIII